MPCYRENFKGQILMQTRVLGKTGTNRLTGVSGAQSLAFSLDANGNTTTENAKTFTYNQNNRLIKASESGTAKKNFGDVVSNYALYLTSGFGCEHVNHHSCDRKSGGAEREHIA